MKFLDDKLSSDSDPLAFLAGGKEMGSLIRSMDWSKTPLGPVAGWPQSLRTTVSICLASGLPICVIWGPGLAQLYNDAYRVICGDKHPRSMGQNFSECWKEAWPVIGKAHDCALAGEKAFLETQHIYLERHGLLEECFFTFSFSPIRDETGRVGGLFHPVIEITAQMLAQRREASEALRASEQQHRLLFEQTVDGILLADSSARSRSRGASAVLSICSGGRTPNARSKRINNSTRARLSRPRSSSSALSSVTRPMSLRPGWSSVKTSRTIRSTASSDTA